MKLNDLLEGINIKRTVNYSNVTVSSVACDSRNVVKNSLFVCFEGNKNDGHDYIDDAVSRGAAALVVRREVCTNIPQIIVENSRRALSVIAGNYYGNPARKMKIITIVGTNGKTSTAEILSDIFSSAGFCTATIGTLGYKIGKQRSKGVLTTPDPLDLNYHLAEMQKAGVEYVFIEASAHAIFYDKLACIKANATILTNITQDHLDFFKTMDEYTKTKLSYFSLDNTALAIINSDDACGRKMIIDHKLPIITYGIENPADVFAIDLKENEYGLSFTVNAFDEIEQIVTPLHGKFNVYNIMSAIGTAMYFGIKLGVIAKALERILPVPGRYNVKYIQDRRVVLDFAHTPDGLNNLLEDLRNNYDGRIVTVFGCGGDRDKLKRPIMGAIAAKYSDFVIITNDNPRFEEAGEIADEIIKGIPAGARYEVILDREKAIRRAFYITNVGDTVVVAGKGHEDYMDIKGKKIPYSDSAVLEKLSR